MAKKEFKKGLMHKTRKELVDFVFRDEHWTKNFGYEGKTEKRKVGDVWEDEFWRYEQKDGYISKESKNHSVYKEIRDYVENLGKCQNPKCEKEKYGFTDNQLIKRIGLCVDCNLQLETEVKSLGLWDYYEKWRMYTRAMGVAKDIIKEIESGIRELKPYYETVAENGEIERWELPKPMDVMKAEMEEEITKLNEGLKEIQEDFVVCQSKLKDTESQILRDRLFPNG